jgi:hypothetical protein
MALRDTMEQLRSLDVGELDLNNIGSWPGAVKVIVIVLLFAVVLGAGYYFYLTDKLLVLEQAQAREADLRRDFENKARQAANLDAYREQKKEMEATFGALLKQLPSDTDGLALEQTLQVGHVRLVVLLVVVIERLAAHHRLERVLRIRKRGNLEIHWERSFFRRSPGPLERSIRSRTRMSRRRLPMSTAEGRCHSAPGTGLELATRRGAH